MSDIMFQSNPRVQGRRHQIYKPCSPCTGSSDGAMKLSHAKSVQVPFHRHNSAVLGEGVVESVMKITIPPQT